MKPKSNQLWSTFFGIILGGGLATGIFAHIKNSNDYLYNVGIQIIANVDKCSEEKRIQDKIIIEVLRILAEKNKRELSQLMEYCKITQAEYQNNRQNNIPINETEGTPEIPHPPNGREEPVKSYITVAISSSESNFKDYSDFKRTKDVFLLTKPKKEIEKLLVDWDDGKGLVNAELKPYGSDKEYFVSSKYYTPGKAVRNIMIVAKYKDGSEEKIQKTIFTYF